MVNQASCYGPNHSLAPVKSNYLPCFSGTSDGYSLCCQEGWTCLNNLLCVYNGGGDAPQNVFPGSLQRGYCTDPTFASKNCPQFCLAGFQNIKNCGDGSGCCKYNGDCTCGVGEPGALLFNVNGVEPYSAYPTSPVTVYTSGTILSVIGATNKPSVPTPIAVSSRPQTVTVPAAILAESASSPGSTIISSSLLSSSSSTVRSSPQSSTFVTTSTSLLFAAASSPTPISSSLSSSSSSSSPATSSSTLQDSNSGVSGLGLKIGVPIGIVVVLAALIFAILLFRRHSLRAKAARQEPQLLPNEKTSQDWVNHDSSELPDTGKPILSPSTPGASWRHGDQKELPGSPDWEWPEADSIMSPAPTYQTLINRNELQDRHWSRSSPFVKARFELG